MNVKLQAEQYSLLLRNRELRSHTMVLNIENQQLKKQLVMQSLRNLHPAATSSTPSSSSSLTFEEGRNGSSENEEVCKFYFIVTRIFAFMSSDNEPVYSICFQKC